jgi:Sulfotransferase domain
MPNLSKFSQPSIGTEKLPNLIIIGAMKCGTTSLHHYLNLHPEITMSSEKELHFFVAEKNWSRGIEWYKSRFNNGTKSVTKIRGETSPSYSACHKWQGVPLRMYSIVPNAKLIYILRDPIERIISHYLHRKASGVENRSFDKVLAQCDGHNDNYIVRSKYYFQLQQYLKYFSPQQILVLTLEELSSNPQITLQKIFRYLEINESFVIPQTAKKLHQSKNKVQKNFLGFLISQLPLIGRVGKLPHEMRWQIEKLLYSPFSQQIEKPLLKPELKQKIIDLLQEDIACLREYTSNDFAYWSM